MTTTTGPTRATGEGGAKIWANSGDSHIIEPSDIWQRYVPAGLVESAPRTEKDGKYETIFVEGRSTRRSLAAFTESYRPPGAYDVEQRIRDLDQEGVWAQLVFPSIGLWTTSIRGAELARECARGYNDWMADEVMAESPRLTGAALLPVVETADAIAEMQRAVERGYQAVFLPTMPVEGREYSQDVWSDFWPAAEEAGVLVAFHIGTGRDPKVYRGPGGAIVNYVETTLYGMRVVTHLVASGVLDRHPNLKVMIVEGGASWVPAIADRMDEAYRQHGVYVKPKLSMLPSELVYRQVYASFQHDRSAIGAVTSMEYRNVMWGDDYPHLEGTYGHTQQTLHDLFDGVDDDTRRLITIDTFESLFDVPPLQA